MRCVLRRRSQSCPRLSFQRPTAHDPAYFVVFAGRNEVRFKCLNLVFRSKVSQIDLFYGLRASAIGTKRDSCSVSTTPLINGTRRSETLLASEKTDNVAIIYGLLDVRLLKASICFPEAIAIPATKAHLPLCVEAPSLCGATRLTTTPSEESTCLNASWSDSLAVSRGSNERNLSPDFLRDDNNLTIPSVWTWLFIKNKGCSLFIGGR